MIEFLEENKTLLLSGVGAALVSGIFGIIIALLSRSSKTKRNPSKDTQVLTKQPALIKRRLVALLSVNIVGHSRLMWEDETNAYELVSQELARMSKYVERNHGAIISLRGDASLCEFKSAVDAVRAAVEFQSRLDPKKGVEFRIGVHLGDVIEGFGKDVYGTSVNIVSRLESMADPGGICASNTIYESVKGKLNVRFEPAGEIGIRHVGEAIKAYRVVVQRAGSQAS